MWLHSKTSYKIFELWKFLNSNSWRSFVVLLILLIHELSMVKQWIARTYKSKWWAMRTSTFYPIIPILLQCTSLQLLWPLQIQKNSILLTYNINISSSLSFLSFCHLKMRLVHHLPHHMLLFHVMNYHPLSCLMQHVMKINPRMLLKKK